MRTNQQRRAMDTILGLCAEITAAQAAARTWPEYTRTVNRAVDRVATDAVTDNPGWSGYIAEIASILEERATDPDAPPGWTEARLAVACYDDLDQLDHATKEAQR